MPRPKKTDVVDPATLTDAPRAQVVPLAPITVDLCRVPELFGLSTDYVAKSDIPRYKISRSKVLVRIADVEKHLAARRVS